MRTITLSDLDLPNTPEMLRLFNSKVRNNISTYNNVYDPSKKPEKKFEIFKISLDEDYFYSLMLTDNLPNGENKELYFDFDIAYKIYSNLVLCR